jgi:hypothetical protein
MPEIGQRIQTARSQCMATFPPPGLLALSRNEHKNMSAENPARSQNTSM